MTFVYTGLVVLALVFGVFIWALMRAASYAEAVLPPKDGQ
jgi:hypothetical protein